MKKEILEQIKKYITDHREELIADLKSLAAIPSILAEEKPDAPFGTACREALDAAVALFRANGFEAEVCSGGKYGIASYGSGKNSIGIFAHTDVVPVSDDWIVCPPFSPVEFGGCLVGRGVHDNKTGVIMALYALRAVRDLGIGMNCRVVVFLGANEETGMLDIDAFVSEQPMPTVSLVPDNEYPICLGEKGIYHLFTKSDAPLRVVREITGGVAVNVILDRVSARLPRTDAIVSRLTPLIAEDPDTEMEEKDGEILLTSHGITSHGSMPEGSKNALKVLLRILVRVPELGEDLPILNAALSWLEDDWGKPFGIDGEDPHFGRTTATNGMVSTEGGHLSLSFDIRYGSSADGKWVEEQVRSAFRRAGFSAYQESNSPGFSIPEDEPDALALIDAYRQVSGDRESSVMYSGGGTYARHLRHAFSCGCEAPWCHIDLDLPVGHGSIHQSDESISIEGLLMSVLTFTAMLADLDATYADR